LKLIQNKEKFLPSKGILLNQRPISFANSPKFSIIVPLYNTPVNYLTEMIDSVFAQTYSNWELCLVDGSEGYSRIEEAILKYNSQKIKFIRLKENKGISENTNIGIMHSSGDYIVLLDHDDILAPNALYEVSKAILEAKADFIYTDEAIFIDKISNIVSIHFKPDFAIDNLRANNYICHLTVFKKNLLEKTGLFRKEYDGSQDFDMVLRLTEVAENIVHIPKVLYFWRSHENSVANNVYTKTYAIKAGKKAIQDHLSRMGIQGTVNDSKISPTIYRVDYKLMNKPVISMIILNLKNNKYITDCIESIIKKTKYDNYEIIIISDENTKHNIKLFNKHVRLINISNDLNIPKAFNIGAEYANGDYLILYNVKNRIVEPYWIHEMLMYGQRKDVGAVGAKLYGPNGRIYHAGVIVGHQESQPLILSIHAKKSKKDIGYMGRLFYSNNVSAVTSDCMLINKQIYKKYGGMDESFKLAYYDIDFCFRLRKAGYWIIFNPYAELLYNSRDTIDEFYKSMRLHKDTILFKERWENVYLSGDPFYNPNLNYKKGDFSLL